MKLLQKILLVMMIILTVGNTDVGGMPSPTHPIAAAVVGENILDFNTIFNIGQLIPASLQPKIYEPAGYQAMGVNNLRYIYFTIFNPGEVEDGNFIHAVRRNQNPADCNIFFPADGSQPTTPEAVQYSCANIDNRENSPITEWYMKIFGVIPFQDDGTDPNHYIKTGWGADAAVPVRQEIIGFHANVDITSIIHDPDYKNNISRRELFIQIFRKIASSSVGRVLLYRILIEINRQATVVNVAGTYEAGILPPPLPIYNSRNNCRSIEIIWGTAFYFSSANSRISVSNNSPKLTVLGKSRAGNDALVSSFKGYIATKRRK